MPGSQIPVPRPSRNQHLNIIPADSVYASLRSLLCCPLNSADISDSPLLGHTYFTCNMPPRKTLPSLQCCLLKPAVQSHLGPILLVQLPAWFSLPFTQHTSQVQVQIHSMKAPMVFHLCLPQSWHTFVPLIFYIFSILSCLQPGDCCESVQRLRRPCPKLARHTDSRIHC